MGSPGRVDSCRRRYRSLPACRVSSVYLDGVACPVVSSHGLEFLRWLGRSVPRLEEAGSLKPSSTTDGYLSMPSVTDLPRPRRWYVAAMLVALGVLVFAAGWALSTDARPERTTGVPSASAAAVDAGHTTATADAYRRPDVSRRPHQMPAALAAAALLVVIGLGRNRSATSRAAPAPLPVWHSAWGSRGPPPLVLV